MRLIADDELSYKVECACSLKKLTAEVKYAGFHIFSVLLDLHKKVTPIVAKGAVHTCYTKTTRIKNVICYLWHVCRGS
jgi:hypothetical protein